MNLFNLAEIELKRENKISLKQLKEMRRNKEIDKKEARNLFENKLYTISDLLKRTIKIRRWFDIHRGIGDKILAGGEVYKFGNRFVVIDQ